MVSTPSFLSFTDQDLALFSEASGDNNPLHLNAEYARRTPYGQQVVFGCLGALACFGQIHLPAGWAATTVEAEFLRPMFLGIPYRIRTWEKEGKQGAWLFDGSTLLVSLTITATARTEHTQPSVVAMTAAAPPSCERREPVSRTPEQIVPGLELFGTYPGASASASAKLAERWGPLNQMSITIFSWASYLIGMELPGECALFSKMALTCRAIDHCLANLNYQASVISVHSRSGQIRIEAALLAGESVIASGQLWSYMRPSIPDIEAGDTTGIKTNAMEGRSAVLIGSSRGLGAAIKLALELRSAAVYSMARSGNEDGELPRTEVGDAADPEALMRLRELVLKEQDHVDMLICNACPPILPLRIEPNSIGRIGAYINQAVALTLAPLAGFLDLLDRAGGCVVIISSSAVEHPVREWPHYIAAKQAVEMLAQVAALQYPRVRFLIVRPPKLLTTMTNTPMGRIGAISPGGFAHRIAERLESPLEPGKPEILG